MTERAAVVVAGAGIVGAWLAFILSRTRLAHGVALIDHSDPGRGVTARSLGLVPPLLRSPKELDRVSSAMLDYQLMDSIYADSSLMRTVASTIVICDEATVPRALPDSLRELNDRQAAAVIDQYLAQDSVSGHRWSRVFICRSFAVNAANLTQRLVEAASERGVRYVRAKLESVETRTDAVYLELDTGSSITADAAVLALGPAPLDALAPKAAGIPATTTRAVTAVDLAVGGDRVLKECLMLPELDTFLLPQLDGSAGLSYPPTQSAMSGQGEKVAAGDVLKVFHPSLCASILRDRSSRDSYNESCSPVVAPLRIGGSVTRVLTITGASGAGVRHAPALAREASSWAKLRAR